MPRASAPAAAMRVALVAAGWLAAGSVNVPGEDPLTEGLLVGKITSVADFWNEEKRVRTFHAGHPKNGELKGRDQFFGFAHMAPGTVPVYSFWRERHGEHTMHMGRPREGEKKEDIVFYALEEQTICTEPVYEFWNEEHGKHTYHKGDPWSGELMGTVLFYAYPHESLASYWDCEAYGCDFVDDYVRGEDYAEERAQTTSIESCMALCLDTPKCTGIDVRDDGHDCTFWFGEKCDVSQRERNPGWGPVHGWRTCTRRCGDAPETSWISSRGHRIELPSLDQKLLADTEVICEAGHYVSKLGGSVGKLDYADAGNAAACEKCAGSTRRRRATSCEPCPKGQFDYEENDDCQDTPEATTTTTSTVTSTTFTTTSGKRCGPGFFSLEGDDCLQCVKGATRRRSFSAPEWCTPCPEGTYDAGDFDDCVPLGAEMDPATGVAMPPPPPPPQTSDVEWPQECMNFTWELIARQDLTELESYFNFEATKTLLQNPDNPQAATWMIVGRIDHSALRYLANNQYRFKLVYDGDVTLEWLQSSWLSESAIRGFRCLHPEDCGPEAQVDGFRFGGLGRSSASTWSVLDGDGGDHWQWFNSVGTVRPYNGGIPAWNAKHARKMQLFVANCGGGLNHTTRTLSSNAAAGRPLSSNAAGRLNDARISQVNSPAALFEAALGRLGARTFAAAAPVAGALALLGLWLRGRFKGGLPLLGGGARAREGARAAPTPWSRVARDESLVSEDPLLE